MAENNIKAEDECCPFSKNQCREDCAMRCDGSCTLAQIAWRIDDSLLYLSEISDNIKEINGRIDTIKENIASIDINGIGVYEQ